MNDCAFDFSTLAIRLKNQQLEILDQTKLPHEEAWLPINNPNEMVTAIQKLQVRGAPLIGVAAALSLGLFAQKNDDEVLINKTFLALRNSRPTAVNLMNALDRCLRVYQQTKQATALLKEAKLLLEEDIKMCQRLGENGAKYISNQDQILHHCNTGGLATAGIGTALGAIRIAWSQGKQIHVWVDETRPLLQGARLTAWELLKGKVPHTLICDHMGASLMAQNKVDKIFVGADRIARNGDFANKIGTYSLAVLAHYHKIPFYVVAPSTTFDESCGSGKDIKIEFRSEMEVKNNSAPEQCRAYNPAFDVTPRHLVTKIIMEDREL